MIVGCSGSGKTTLLLSMLLKWMYPDKVTLYTLNADPDSHQLLEDYFDLLQEEIGGEEPMFEIIDPEDVVPIENIDNILQIVVLFDDIEIDGKHMKPIEEYGISHYREIRNVIVSI